MNDLEMPYCILLLSMSEQKEAVIKRLFHFVPAWFYFGISFRTYKGQCWELEVQSQDTQCENIRWAIKTRLNKPHISNLCLSGRSMSHVQNNEQLSGSTKITLVWTEANKLILDTNRHSKLCAISPLQFIHPDVRNGIEGLIKRLQTDCIQTTGHVFHRTVVFWRAKIHHK